MLELAEEALAIFSAGPCSILRMPWLVPPRGQLSSHNLSSHSEEFQSSQPVKCSKKGKSLCFPPHQVLPGLYKGAPLAPPLPPGWRSVTSRIINHQRGFQPGAINTLPAKKRGGSRAPRSVDSLPSSENTHRCYSPWEAPHRPATPRGRHPRRPDGGTPWTSETRLAKW